MCLPVFTCVCQYTTLTPKDCEVCQVALGTTSYLHAAFEIFCHHVKWNHLGSVRQCWVGLCAL